MASLQRPFGVRCVFISCPHLHGELVLFTGSAMLHRRVATVARNGQTRRWLYGFLTLPLLRKGVVSGKVFSGLQSVNSPLGATKS